MIRPSRREIEEPTMTLLLTAAAMVSLYLTFRSLDRALAARHR